MAEPSERRAYTRSKLGIKANIDASAAGTMVSGAWTVTSSGGDGGATLDLGSPDFPVAGGYEGEHRVLEVEAADVAAPASGGNDATAASAIDEDARCPAHGCRGGGAVEGEGEGEGEPGKGAAGSSGWEAADASSGGGAEEPVRRCPLHTALGPYCNVFHSTYFFQL